MSIFQPFSFSPHHRRSLYDQYFFDTGCDLSIIEEFGGEEGIALTQVDDTVGTWATNYAVLALGILGIFVFGCVKEPKHEYKRFAFASAYYGFTGLGYGVAGVNHQIRKFETDYKFYFVAYILTIMGAMSLQFQIAMNCKAGGNQQNCYTILTLLIGLAVILVSALWGIELVGGVYLVVANLWFVVYFLVIKDWMAVVGSLVIIAGFALQFFLRSTCGLEAYPQCFQDCIMPDPQTFNHNGLFHSLVVLGMFVQLFARFIPIESSSENEESDNEEGVRKTSTMDEGEVESNA